MAEKIGAEYVLEKRIEALERLAKEDCTCKKGEQLCPPCHSVSYLNTLGKIVTRGWILLRPHLKDE